MEDTECLIRETAAYIGDAERLADDPGVAMPAQDSLSAIFGVDIIRIIKYLGDPP